ncbi:hypothetical protein [Phenylobacterium sp.]|jgi:hypothetical protein|uniref:hypothetical protein n=1 Tax=Phenylobacterium sp. TaxID=1871053 RepID=UPI002F92ACBD
MRFARWVFTGAGLFGLLMITPLFFLEGRMAALSGAPLSNPEHYYGFLAVTFAWQLVYLVIGRNPAPYRPIMLLGALGKTMFVGLSAWLTFSGRLDPQVALLASPDLLLAALFVVAWWRTRGQPS